MIQFKISKTFCSSHVYRNPNLSSEENFKVFGKCSNEDGHGHNYKITAQFSAETNSDINIANVALQKFIDHVDHHHINQVIAEFKIGKEIPTTENLARWFFQKITAQLGKQCKLQSLTLFETENIWATVEI